MPTRDRRPAAPLQPPSAAKLAKDERPVIGADLQRLPRDRCGRAVIDESVIPRAVAANDGGLSWPVIADMLGCGEKNLRERAGKWKRLQKAQQDAAEALAFATGKRQQAGPVPEGVPVSGVDPGREVFVLGEASVDPGPEAEAPSVPEVAAYATDPLLWDITGPSGHLLATGQSSTLSCRLMTVLAAAGVSCSRSLCPNGPHQENAKPRLVRSDSMAAAYAKASQQPTTAPVITPTKAGGFMVQVTVNPLESGG